MNIFYSFPAHTGDDNSTKQKMTHYKHPTPDQLNKVIAKIYVVSEDDLFRPEDRQSMLMSKKFEFLRSFLKRRFVSMFSAFLKYGFMTWWNNMDHLREVQRDYCALKIQTFVRMWLCRVCTPCVVCVGIYMGVTMFVMIYVVCLCI